MKFKNIIFFVLGSLFGLGVAMTSSVPAMRAAKEITETAVGRPTYDNSTHNDVKTKTDIKIKRSKLTIEADTISEIEEKESWFKKTFKK